MENGARSVESNTGGGPSPTTLQVRGRVNQQFVSPLRVQDQGETRPEALAGFQIENADKHHIRRIGIKGCARRRLGIEGVIAVGQPPRLEFDLGKPARRC